MNGMCVRAGRIIENSDPTTREKNDKKMGNIAECSNMILM
jgi:hypothetical protein